MGDLLPKNDYFKHTTRSILTEAEKQETVNAVERALSHLLERCRNREYTFTSIADAAFALKAIRHQYRHLDRCIHFVKGTRQPRHLYRRSRRSDVEIEARRIALETGAPYQEVREEFLNLMDDYISPQP
jgi:glutathione S-transferase